MGSVERLVTEACINPYVNKQSKIYSKYLLRSNARVVKNITYLEILLLFLDTLGKYRQPNGKIMSLGK
jgi:hypothetical protein